MLLVYQMCIQYIEQHPHGHPYTTGNIYEEVTLFALDSPLYSNGVRR